MSEEVHFEYSDGFTQDFIYIYQRLTKTYLYFFIIPITDCIDWEMDELDIWYEEIYEKCPNRDIPDEYMDLDDYYKNPDNPKMTKNIKKYEFCSMKNATDDYSCVFDECPRRN